MHLLSTHLTLLVARIAISLAMYQGSSSRSSNADTGSVKIGKCCESNELMVDGRCTPIKKTIREMRPWIPEFRNENGQPLIEQPKFEFEIGSPRCKNNEKQWEVYHAPEPPMDILMILPSGKLRHCIQCHLDELSEAEEVEVEGDSNNNNNNNKVYYDYEFGSYCADKIILSNDKSPKVYARVCLPENKRGMQPDTMMRRVIDPAFRAIAIACYLVVAIVYFVLPQLRNLIGNIITSMTLCLVTSQCADMVKIFTEFSNHVSFLVAGITNNLYSQE